MCGRWCPMLSVCTPNTRNGAMEMTRKKGIQSAKRQPVSASARPSSSCDGQQSASRLQLVQPAHFVIGFSHFCFFFFEANNWVGGREKKKKFPRWRPSSPVKSSGRQPFPGGRSLHHHHHQPPVVVVQKRERNKQQQQPGIKRNVATTCGAIQSQSCVSSAGQPQQSALEGWRKCGIRTGGGKKLMSRDKVEEEENGHPAAALVTYSPSVGWNRR